MSLSERLRVPLALAAIASCVIAAGVAGMATQDYSQLSHPLAWLGAKQLGAAGTLFGLFLTPVFYVALRKLANRPLVSHAPAVTHG